MAQRMEEDIQGSYGIFSNEMFDLIRKKAVETADSRAFDDDFYRSMLDKTMSQLNFYSRLDLDNIR